MNRSERAAWTFVAPALTAIALFFVLPTVAALFLSFTDFDIYALADSRNMRIVGIENYARLLQNPLFWGAFGQTIWFVIFGTPLSIAASLAAALLLNAQAVKLRALWRVALFAPYVTTLVATAVVWRYLLHTRYGLINAGLGDLGLPRPDWLGDPNWAMPAILIFVIWKTFGYNMLIFLAVLQSVPQELHEAARIDGAGPWARFRHVTLPAIGPALALVSIVSMAGFFQLFAEPYVMTQGGPLDSTYSLVMLMYEQGFRWWRLGFASSVAFVLFALTLAATGVQLRLQRRSAL